jgi:glycosyltransferase involved in cell wall biosynthesis/peptidoglycan/xylan/chitin deacetylase (PgdA/CDA1 family)
MQPLFSVVIPTYQRRDVVLQTVQSLAHQEGAPPFEVIVVVDGSTDGTADALRALTTPFPLTVFEQENQGRSRACNRGAEAAVGELLLFLDDDMDADPRLLAEHARSHREGADVVFGDIPLHPDSPPTFLARSVGEWADRRRRELAERNGRLDVTDFVTGQTSLPRAAFVEVGGFDTGFTRRGSFGGEDFDLGLRLRDAGATMAFNPAAVSKQRYVVTPRLHLRQWHDAGRARVMLARKYPAHAQALLDRRERRADRLVWRRLRRPLRSLVLRRVERGHDDERTVRGFRRVRDLEFFAGVRAAGGVPEPRAARVLCYHAIADLKGAAVLEQYGVPADTFRRQLRFLARHFHFVDGPEFVRSLQGAGLPRRPVLLTFDDCTRDLLETALPALREHDAPAVAFAVTDRLGGTNDWDRGIGAPPLELLDATGLVELSRSGVAIGSHTRTHPKLDRLSDDELEGEIEGSIADLERAGLPRPTLLAYPHGVSDERVRGAAAAAGLAGAFSTRPGLASVGGDRFAIPRIEILRRNRGVFFWLKVVTGRRLRRP